MNPDYKEIHYNVVKRLFGLENKIVLKQQENAEKMQQLEQLK